MNITNKNGNNFYDIIKEKEKSFLIDKIQLENYEMVEEFMNKKFPQYKELWELKGDMKKYNL